MIQTLIFDLSEVIIAGLLGIERPLAERLQLPPEEVLTAFGGSLLQSLCCGELSEDDYLGQILQTQQWLVSPDELKQIIRQNFHEQVPGTATLLESLAGHYELVLLSDHAREWVDYIRSVHPLPMFKFIFFSYELGQTKRTPSTFRKILEQIGRQPEACLFIDDSLTNIQAAATIGLTGIRFESAAQLRQVLSEKGIAHL